MNPTAPLIDLIDFDAYQKTKTVDSLSHLGIFSAFDLGRTVFPAIKFILPGYLPEGATILAGRPKLGKSWLALTWCWLSRKVQLASASNVNREMFFTWR